MILRIIAGYPSQMTSSPIDSPLLLAKQRENSGSIPSYIFSPEPSLFQRSLLDPPRQVTEFRPGLLAESGLLDTPAVSHVLPKHVSSMRSNMYASPELNHDVIKRSIMTSPELGDRVFNFKNGENGGTLTDVAPVSRFFIYTHTYI